MPRISPAVGDIREIYGIYMGRISPLYGPIPVYRRIFLLYGPIPGHIRTGYVRRVGYMKNIHLKGCFRI